MRIWSLSLGLIALTACLGDDDKPADDTGEVVCGSTQGFVYGNVTAFGGPSTDATVYAWPDGGGTATETATVDGGGNYELNLDPGDYVLYAENSDYCYSVDVPVTVVECEEEEVDIDIVDCETADKPNLYLYPSVDTPTRVTMELDAKQAIVASDPVYRDPMGWRGVAHTDGTFSVGDYRADFLFYEVSLAPWQRHSMQRDQGWCVPGGPGSVMRLAQIVEAYGFNSREVDDFVEGWRFDLPPAPMYAVYPQTRVDHMADLDIQPALPVDRLWLLVEEGSGCTIDVEPAVVPFSRDGAHAVEWGVILRDFVL